MEWKEYVGKRFYCFWRDTNSSWICTKYHDGDFWMRNEKTNEMVSISNRAIDRSWYRLKMAIGSWNMLRAAVERGSVPKVDEKGFSVEHAGRTLSLFGYIKDGEVTDAGKAALERALAYGEENWHRLEE